MNLNSPEARAKALQARKLKVASASELYRRDWADADNWDSLARNRGIRAVDDLRTAVATLGRKSAPRLHTEKKPKSARG